MLKGAIKVYLLDQTKTIFDSWHCTIKAVNTDLDHIHILFEAPPQVQLSKLANNYKTVTSRLIRKNFDADWTRGKHEADCRVVFCAALRKDHLLIVVGRGKVRLEHDIVEQLLAGCEQNIDLRTPGIMLGL